MKKERNLAKLKLHYMLHGMGGSPIVPFGYNNILITNVIYMLFSEVFSWETAWNNSTEYGSCILCCSHCWHHHQAFVGRSSRQVNIYFSHTI